MNTIELSRDFPHAFNALPECYQNDDCLFFWWDEPFLFCKPAEGQEFALGEWVACFDNESQSWGITIEIRGTI